MTVYWKNRENDPWFHLNPEWGKQKPFGVSGLFRVKNEAEWLHDAVASHMPWLDEAMIIYQDSSDRTEQIIEELREEFGYGKVRRKYYRSSVAQPLTKKFAEMPDDSVNSFVYLSNWGLSYCKYSWIAKIEGDVIGLSSFAKIREEVDKYPNAIRYYGRTGLNMAGRNCEFFSGTHPTNAGWDEAVFNNNPDLWHFIKIADKWESVNMDTRRDDMRQMGMSFLHTKRCKAKQIASYESPNNKEEWVPYTEENLKAVLGDRYDPILMTERIER